MSRQDTIGLKETVSGTTPSDHGLPGALWNASKVAVLLALKACRDTVCRYLRALGLAWKKTKKLLGKASPEKRAAYLAQFERLFAEMSRGERTLIFVDEAHLHQDMDLGYGWHRKGVPFWVPSTSPGLHAKINWYGAYDFSCGRAFIWAYPKCNGEATADFLQRLAEWANGRPRVTVIWDGSPVHRARVARKQADDLGLEVVFLPPYSPDLNPIEGLWKWMREEVTYGRCHESVASLFAACLDFVDRINLDPLAMIRRLWPKFALESAEEALRVSK